MRPFLRGSINTSRSTANKKLTNKSLASMALSLMRRGLIREVRPSTAQILKILEPMMLPTEISFSFRNTAMSEVANSGTLVPKATIEIPMTLSLTLQFSARDLDPFTNHSAPTYRPATDNTMRLSACHNKRPGAKKVSPCRADLRRACQTDHKTYSTRASTKVKPSQNPMAPL